MGNTTLDRMKPGEKGRVLQMDVKGLMRRRLYDMGITPGTEIVFKKRAPLGDPLEVHLRGYALSLRISEASLVNMEVEEGAPEKAEKGKKVKMQKGEANKAKAEGAAKAGEEASK